MDGKVNTKSHDGKTNITEVWKAGRYIGKDVNVE